MVTTIFCSVTSCVVFVLGTSTSMLDWRMGAVIMKMMSRTRTTSMNGTMLISDRDDCVLEICGINLFAAWGGRGVLQLKDFSICAVTSSAKVSNRCPRLRMFCKN